MIVASLKFPERPIEKEIGMSEGLPVDAVALRDEVKAKYRSVAVDPHEGSSRCPR